MGVPEVISEFIEENKIASICFTDKEQKPHCLTCFYYYEAEESCLVFKSSYGTQHDMYIKANTPVAGTILPPANDLLKIKGIQFSGHIITEAKNGVEKLKLHYTMKYPRSITLPGYIWVVKLSYIKFTRNSLGFSNKLIWDSDAETQNRV